MSMAEIPLHKKLVDVAYRWVLKSGSCGVAFKELNTNACNGEYPDVIGFGEHAHSVLIEVKTSRSDFHADKKKSFRRNPELGMGSERFFCCPTGLLKIEDLPEGWGLIYVNDKLKAKSVHNPFRGPFHTRHHGHPKNIKAEHGLMYSALRRLHLRGLINEIYTVVETRYIVEPEIPNPADKTTRCKGGCCENGTGFCMFCEQPLP